tara:strand:- start:791 stop:961 length:171 start_codon:yes stop_codon:yes gene_type:complete
MTKIRPVNPVAQAMAHGRRRAQIVPAKRGKGSYDRNKEKSNAQQQESSKDVGKKTT